MLCKSLASVAERDAQKQPKTNRRTNAVLSRRLMMMIDSFRGFLCVSLGFLCLSWLLKVCFAIAMIGWKDSTQSGTLVLLLKSLNSLTSTLL